MISIINRINTLLKKYKEQLDALASSYDAERKRHHEKAIDMRAENCYTDAYIDEFERNFKPNQDYAGLIKATRDAYLTAYDGLCEKFKSKITAYFNAPISQDFSNKIQTIIASKLMLTDREFKVLENEANSYLERRLFNQLASTRTDAQGKPNAYPYISIPKIDLIESYTNDYINSGRNFIKLYCGTVERPKSNAYDRNNVECAVLHTYADTNVLKHLCIGVDNVLKNDRAKELCDYLIKEGVAQQIKPLSNDERALLDTLIEAEQYPYSFKDRVKEHSQNPLVKDLLLRDERFAEYVPTE